MAYRKVVIRFLIFLVVRFFITVQWVKTKNKPQSVVARKILNFNV